MRLDKFLSDNSDYSRKQLKQLIRQGKACVNGTIIKQAQFQLDPSQAKVELKRQVIAAFSFSYYMLNKPGGIICDRGNALYPDVFSLIEFNNNKYPLQVAGRLDQDTTGLVLLSNDGPWLHRVSSGQLDKNKIYQVELAQALSNDAIEALKAGVLLNGEDQPSLAKALVALDSHNCELTIDEGKYHQVKRMFAAVSNKVSKLHRSQIGDIELDKSLKPGQFRPLCAAEIDSI